MASVEVLAFAQVQCLIVRESAHWLYADINECALGTPCPTGSQCFNTPGSFLCGAFAAGAPLTIISGANKTNPLTVSSTLGGQVLQFHLNMSSASSVKSVMFGPSGQPAKFKCALAVIGTVAPNAIVTVQCKIPQCVGTGLAFTATTCLGGICFQGLIPGSFAVPAPYFRPRSLRLLGNGLKNGTLNLGLPSTVSFGASDRHLLPLHSCSLHSHCV